MSSLHHRFAASRVAPLQAVEDFVGVRIDPERRRGRGAETNQSGRYEPLARVPVDDPNTHLELTMIHEVMILDHSGPDLAILQYAAGLKLTVCAALIAGLLNPISWLTQPWLAAGVSLGLVLAVAVLVGCVESLIARIRMKAIPRYTAIAMIAGALALLLVVLRSKGSP